MEEAQPRQSAPPPPALPPEPDGSVALGDSVGTPGQDRPRRRRGGVVVIVLLSLALAAATGTLAYYLVQLDAANTRVGEQERQLREQQELIDKKETFGIAMEGLLDTARQFDGVLLTGMIPFSDYEALAARAWTHRWKPAVWDRVTADARAAARELETMLAAAGTEAATNVSGSTYEAVTDRLGGGFIASVIGDTGSICEADAFACVSWDDPYTVHFDAASGSAPYMSDWLRTGVAYHEFAHALQLTNPEPTATALASFGEDIETMADCFALTYLDGWALDHRIWLNRYQYWDVSIGYGHTCDDAQRQAIRDWYGQLGFAVRPIFQ